MGIALFLYNLMLWVGLLLLSPLWLGYLLLVPKARAGFWEKLGIYPEAVLQRILRVSNSRRRLWFHAVSVGEFNAIKALVAALQSEYDIVVSTTTRTGHDLALRTFPDLSILYFPYDLRPVLHKAVRLVQPDLVIVAETELWPNFIDVVTRSFQTPLILINGRLSARSYRGYLKIQLFMKACLQRMTHLYMQSQADAQRVRALGDLSGEQVTVVGNLKFDIAPTVEPLKRARLKRLLGIQEGDTVLTLASTHSGEDAFLLDAYLALKKDFPELKLVLAPRHPERLNEIRGILNGKALSHAVRSQLTDDLTAQADILVLDSIGELLTVYSFSTVAVMGGSFIERGGQNPLEALSQRVPVVFGPYMHNFVEISRLILEANAGYQVSAVSQAELHHVITGLLTQPEVYDSIAEHGQQLLENNRGAREAIERAIHHHLSENGFKNAEATV